MQITDAAQTEHHRRTCSIASTVINKIGYGVGELLWVANQRDSILKIDYIGVAFALEKGIGIKEQTAFISKDDFTKTDEELVADCAQQILGYPLHSKEDYQRRAAFMRDMIHKEEAELTVLQERLAGYKDNLAWLEEKVEALKEIDE